MTKEEARKHKRLTVQKSFEKYITKVLKPGYDKANLYGEVDGLFTFSNGASLFQLNEPLIVSEFITDKQRSGARWESRSKFDTEAKLDEMLARLKTMYETRMSVDSKEEDIKQKEVTLVVGKNRILFNIYQFSYMEKFLGKNVLVHVSPIEKIAYGESDKGKGYVLGLRPRKKEGLVIHARKDF